MCFLKIKTFVRADYHLVKNWSPESWRKITAKVTQDSKSRRMGRSIKLSKVGIKIY